MAKSPARKIAKPTSKKLKTRLGSKSSATDPDGIEVTGRADKDVYPWSFEDSMLGSTGFGPFEIQYTIHSNSVDIVILLAGIKIGSGTLTARDNKLCASMKLVVIKGKICVVADFAAREIRADGEHCYKDLLTRWHCKKFKRKIVGW